MTTNDLEALREPVLALVREAGQAIMNVYGAGFEVSRKDDRSPLTEADLASHRILVAGLGRLLPGVPVLSEESPADEVAARHTWSRFWLVDPLDGTREFVERSDEFTVNVALIEDGHPILGVVHAPALEETASAVAGGALHYWRFGSKSAPTRRADASALPRVAISRSHHGSRNEAALARLGSHERLVAGSALKFVRVATGAADVYLRLGPTSEWDTAAGQCLVEAVGGRVAGLDGRPLRYNQRATLVNDDFIAARDPEIDWIARFGLRGG